MKALVVNCTLKKSPETSNTEALSNYLAEELDKKGVEVHFIRAVDQNILPGVKSDEGPDDDWPPIRKEILGSDILVLASPTWLGRMSSVAMRVIERMDGLFWERDNEGKPPAYNRVAGFVATGSTDGAKHVIAEMEAALLEVGFTVPGQAWTYFNNGSPGGEGFADASPMKQQAAKALAAKAASNLVAAAKALKENPIPKPPETK